LGVMGQVDPRLPNSDCRVICRLSSGPECSSLRYYPASIIASSPKSPGLRRVEGQWPASQPPSSFTVGLRSVSDEMAARTTRASKKTELTAPFSVAKHLISGISRRSTEVCRALVAGEPYKRESSGVVLATRSPLTGSNRPVPCVRTAAEEIVLRRAAATAHARELRRNVDR
jgi:hypothetical protein